MTRLFVKADKQGEILAVFKGEELPEGRESPFEDDTNPEVVVLEIKDNQRNAAFKDMEVVDIHTGYQVDTKKMALKKKSPS